MQFIFSYLRPRVASLLIASLLIGNSNFMKDFMVELSIPYLGGISNSKNTMPSHPAQKETKLPPSANLTVFNAFFFQSYFRHQLGEENLTYR